MKNRLLYRILASFAALILFTAAVMGLLYARQIKVDIVGEIRNDLIAQMRIAALSGMHETEKKLSLLAEISHSRVTLVDASGRVRGDSEKDLSQMDSHLNRPEIQEARVRGQGEAIRYSRTLGVDMLYVAFPVSEGREVKGYIRFARPLFDVKKAVDEQYVSIYRIILITVIPAFIIALLLAAKFISPVEKVISYTHKVSSGGAYGTLLIESDNDVGQLEKDINRIVEDQQEKVRTAREDKAKLEATFASMTEGILIVDDRYRIEYGNERMKRILGNEDISDVTGKTPLEAFRNAELQDAIELFRNSGGPVSREVTLGGETPVILDVSVSAVVGLPAGEQKTLIVFHDVTRIRKLEKIREDFVANVTHEIKTPLTSIIGFIETLEGGAIGEEETAKKFLHIISENAHRLGRLVDDLLTLSSIELGEMEFRFEDVSIADAIEGVLPMFEARAAEKSLTLDKRIQGELPLIMADRDKLTQVLVNILDNAVKFTPAGGNISIAATYDDDSVSITVSDTGIGIPKMEIPRLGERFYRVDKTRSQELGGTGLGLSIVKHLMKAHNGNIEIESRMGKGTSVFLRFPANRAQRS